MSARTDDVARRTSFTRPGAAMEMVFPSFNLFDNDADYYSEYVFLFDDCVHSCLLKV